MYNAIFLFYGALAILSQLVIFRELAVLFYGNELFLGTFLSSWLFWTGLGSLSARRFLKDRGRVSSYLSYAFLALSFMLPTMILLVRASRSMFPLGEFIGPVPTVLYTFMAMGAVCFVMGGQFSLACALAPPGEGIHV